MKLEGINGEHMTVKLVGYQFPEISTGWDGNWVLADVRVNDPRGNWAFVDPCLTTWEVERLAQWIDDIAAGRDSEHEWTFTEPVLAFQIRPYGRGRTLRALFDLEGAPPWRPRQMRSGGSPSFIDFRASPSDLADAARALRESLAEFPARGAPKGF